MTVNADTLNAIESAQAENREAQAKMFDLLKQQTDDIKRHGETSESTAKAIAEVEASMKSQANEVMDRLREQDTAIETLQKQLGRSRALGGDGQVSGGNEILNKSIGEIFTESDEYKEGLAKAGNRKFPSVSEVMMPASVLKSATLTSADGSAGAAIDLFATLRMMGIVAPPLQARRVLDLLRVTQTADSSIEYIEESDFNQIYTTFAAQEIAGQTVLSVTNANGFVVGSTVILDPDGDKESATITAKNTTSTPNTITVSAGITNQREIGDGLASTEYEYTAETQLKPNGRFKFVKRIEPVKTLATWVPITRQLMMDVPRMRSHINTRLSAGMDFTRDRQILYGDASDTQLNGIASNARTQTYLWSSGSVGDRKIDALRRAMTLASLAHYGIDGGVVNPQDWEDIEIAKASDGHYIWQSAPGGRNGAMVWAVPYVQSTACDAGDFFVGAWRVGAEYFDRERASLRVSEHHEDYFTRNQLALLMEAREALVLSLPEAFVAGTFDSAPV